MYDTITTLGNSVIQHGFNNDRIYLMKLAPTDFPSIIKKMDNLAASKGYSKIFAKVPTSALEAFREDNYVIEASIPKFYKGTEDAYFLGKYFSEERKQPHNKSEIDNILRAAKAKSIVAPENLSASPDLIYRKCHPADINEITDLYKQVFETYPFPIHNPDYIEKTMTENVTYFGAWHEGILAALASAEMDLQAANAEMTDFAARPDYRGKGLSTSLLYKMEGYIQEIGLKTAYTIARSFSYGMNITFAKLGYIYSGTLINNTNISGSLESMNVWYKNLA